MIPGTEEEPFSPLDFTMLEEDIDAFVLEGLATEVRETIWLPKTPEPVKQELNVVEKVEKMKPLYLL